MKFRNLVLILATGLVVQSAHMFAAAPVSSTATVHIFTKFMQSGEGATRFEPFSISVFVPGPGGALLLVDKHFAGRSAEGASVDPMGVQYLPITSFKMPFGQPIQIKITVNGVAKTIEVPRAALKNLYKITFAGNLPRPGFGDSPGFLKFTDKSGKELRVIVPGAEPLPQAGR